MTKIVFFGNEKLATGVSEVDPVIKNALLESGYAIEQTVTGPLSTLRPHEAKIAVLAAYGQIIPQKTLDEFPQGIINIHPSLLPAYRGPTPIEQAILDGATKTGVSIMQLTAGMDEGPLYKQKAVHLSGTDTKTELTKQLQALGAELLLEVLPNIISGELKPRQQPHPDRATYTKKITKEDGVLDWQKSAEELERQIRAYQGWPGSKTNLAGKEVTITQAHISLSDETPGKVEVTPGLNTIIVHCGHNSLCIEKLQPAGKKEMTSKAFIAGHKDKL
jgi:methionyl-tRNA formyltransferase